MKYSTRVFLGITCTCLMLVLLQLMSIKKTSIPTVLDNTGRVSGSSQSFAPTTVQTPYVRPQQLVNIPVNFFKNGGGLNRSIRHSVLLYNKPPWIKNEARVLETCEYNNCLFTVDRRTLQNASAVVYYPSHVSMGIRPPPRPPGQLWVFYSLEPPMNFYFGDYLSPAWHNTMNWSMTYRLESDVFAPYGRFALRKVPPKRDYDEVWSKKRRFAVMISSHCNTVSKREVFVQQLKKYGVDVTVLGRCGVRVKDSTDTADFVKLVNEFKFVFAFENSFCPDYVTEKLMQRYGYDVISVVRGGANYNKLLNGIPLINTADFANMSLLAEYMLKLGNDKDMYTHFLREKDKYESFTEDSFGYPYAMCELCRKINFKDDNRNVIKSIPEYMALNQCYSPRDLLDNGH